MEKILIIEDDKNMLKGLKFNLEARSFDVITAPNGEAGYRKAVEEHPDLVILDIMLPGKSGFEVCKDLKKSAPTLPIIMLTARSQESDVVTGLDLGADDYITKPFGVLELIARVKALLRRVNAGKPLEGIFRFANLLIDFNKYEIQKDGKALILSPLEFHILQCLIENRGQVVSREELLNRAWGYHSYPNTRTVDVHIARLREKIEGNPEEPKLILTIHGLGYKWLG